MGAGRDGLVCARAGKAARAARLWDSGDVGGFECAVPKDRSKAAAEVYRADDASEGVTSVHAVHARRHVLG